MATDWLSIMPKLLSAVSTAVGAILRIRLIVKPRKRSSEKLGRKSTQ